MFERKLHSVFSKTWLYLAAAAAVALVGFVGSVLADDGSASNGQHLITIYDRGVEQTIITRAATVREALSQANITVDAADLVEPGLDQELVADHYNVNVYRARPVIVEDGSKRVRTVTAAQSPTKIAEAAKMTLYPEDDTKLSRVDDVVSEGGAGLKMAIDRATPFTFVLYGKPITDARTQATTVGDMLKEKGVVLGAKDDTSVSLETPLTSGMTVQVWRNGVQTATLEEEIAMPVEQVKDQDRLIGYKAIQTPGKPGKKMVTYEINMQNGVEISRKVIQQVETLAPVKQVEIVGAKSSGNPLTKSMGVNHFTDSNGVTHRETYYDLNMSGVMGNCGGGTYTIRADGAKIDKDGYILIAANLSIYPRCSVVETSMGAGKVYDTGGFVRVHPHGWDLATDWSNGDGR